MQKNNTAGKELFFPAVFSVGTVMQTGFMRKGVCCPIVDFVNFYLAPKVNFVDT